MLRLLFCERKRIGDVTCRFFWRRSPVRLAQAPRCRPNVAGNECQGQIRQRRVRARSVVRGTFIGAFECRHKYIALLVDWTSWLVVFRTMSCCPWVTDVKWNCKLPVINVHFYLAVHNGSLNYSKFRRFFSILLVKSWDESYFSVYTNWKFSRMNFTYPV